jgi:hypothetical protein
MHHSYEWNDYEYCLPHLLDKYDQYKLFFQKAKKDGRFIIMDNGLFENVKHTTQDLIIKINEFSPSIFVVPDEWNDSSATLRNAKEWMTNHQQYLPETTNLMAVCQGKTLGELITTYQTLLDLGYKHVAFNHSSIAYQTMFPNYTPLTSQMYGRMEFIRQLVMTKTIDKSVWHHLLGASDWREYMVYNDWEFIKSGDTSSPIINGANGIRLDYLTTYNKPTDKLEDIMELNFEGKIDDIIFNVNKFKEIIKLKLWKK